MSEAGVMFYTLYISSLLLGLPPPTVVSACGLGGKKYHNIVHEMLFGTGIPSRGVLEAKWLGRKEQIQ